MHQELSSTHLPFLQILGVHNSLAVARSLKQQTAGAEATVVATPQEFIDAVEKGDLHIEVQAHLDLTTIQPQFSSTMLFLTTKGLGQTIRVRTIHEWPIMKKLSSACVDLHWLTL